jgi:putative lipoprotein
MAAGNHFPILHEMPMFEHLIPRLLGLLTVLCLLPGGVHAAGQSSFIEIKGSVSYRERIALPPAAVLKLMIQDTSRVDTQSRALTEQVIELNGRQVPVAFQMLLDRDLLRQGARVTLSARIEHQGRVLFINDRSYPVLKDGQPVPLNVVLRAPRNRPD